MAAVLTSDRPTPLTLSPYLQAKETASAALQRVAAFNRRTLDGITSKLYFYFSWTHECTDSLADIRGCALPPVTKPPTSTQIL